MDMSVEEGVKLVRVAGLITPPYAGDDGNN